MSLEERQMLASNNKMPAMRSLFFNENQQREWKHVTFHVVGIVVTVARYGSHYVQGLFIMQLDQLQHKNNLWLWPNNPSLQVL